VGVGVVEVDVGVGGDVAVPDGIGTAASTDASGVVTRASAAAGDAAPPADDAAAPAPSVVFALGPPMGFASKASSPLRLQALAAAHAIAAIEMCASARFPERATPKR